MKLAIMPIYRDLPSASQSNLNVSRKVADKAICLSICPDLTPEQVLIIFDVIEGEGND